MKNLLSVLLSVVLILSAFAIAPFAIGAVETDDSETGVFSGISGDCFWRLDDNDVLTISGSGKMENYSYFEAAPWGKSITKVVITNDVTSIGDYAFSGCNKLTSVSIGNSVTTIGMYTFNECSSLTEVTIPESVTTIDDGAFCFCFSLKSVIIPDSVMRIGGYAFSGCDNLSSVFIGNSVISIGDQAFSCGRGKGASNILSKLKRITVDNNNPAYCSIDGNLYDKSASTLIQYAIGKTAESFTIPDSVTTIGNNAFKNCRSGLSSVIIPNTVASIGKDAFTYCLALTSITIPDSVTSIGEYAFYGCVGLSSITIPDSVTSIGEAAFSDCRNLNSVYISDSITNIEMYTFDSCSALTFLTIPDSVTSIGDFAFNGCFSLTSIVIPASVTSIGNEVFCGCGNLRILYGYKGTAAEIYANNNGYIFIPIRDITDPSTGVIISIPESITLSIVKEIEQETDELPDGKTATDVYNINLTKSGDTIQSDCVVTIKIPSNAPNAKIYRKEADNTYTDMNAIYKDGYLIFYTDHSDTYVMADGDNVKCVLLGDADGDGEVTIIDATNVQRKLVELPVPNFNEKAADVDGDGLNITDATYIQRYLAEIQTPYPIGEVITE